MSSPSYAETAAEILALPGDPWLTRGQAAVYMEISTDTVDRWRRSGRLRETESGKGRPIRIRRSWCDRALAWRPKR